MENQSTAQTKPMMTFPNAVKTCLRKYGDFSGRATRAEFWWWTLAVVIGSFIFSAVDSSIASFSGPGWDYTPFATIFGLAVILPDLAVTARRLHDIGKSGWWQLVWYAAIPVAVITLAIGLIFAIVLSGDASWDFTSEGGFNWEGDNDIPAASALAFLLGVGIAFLIGLGVFIWGLVWMISQGQAGPNRHGLDPRASDPAAPE